MAAVCDIPTTVCETEAVSVEEQGDTTLVPHEQAQGGGDLQVLAACCELGSCRNLGVFSTILQQNAMKSNIGALREVFLVEQHEDICVGGRRLPANNSLTIDRLEISSTDAVVVCPKAAGTEPCCPEAATKPKTDAKLGLEKYLTVYILLAVVGGVTLGQLPHVDDMLTHLKVGHTNILTAVGMIIMLLPPFASVHYDQLPRVLRTIPKRFVFGSLLFNWIVGPLVMLALGITVLPEHSDLLQGVIFIGAARCIAMVLVWTAIAGGDSFLCVSIVLINSVATVFLYTPVVTMLNVTAGLFGVKITHGVDFLTVLQNVAIYLGLPLAIGTAMWSIGHRSEKYWSAFLPRFAPSGLIALLFSIVVMFAEMSKPLLQGGLPMLDVMLVMVPLLIYFAFMFGSSWVVSRWILRASFAQTVVFAFTAAGNNFELALAACTAIFGTSSKQAVATVVGPLLEIPGMLALVKVAQLWKYHEPDFKDSSSTM